MSTIKYCPGLKDKPYCGRERKGQEGYCPDCRREYQRDRYATLRRDAVRTYSPRTQTRVDAVKCHCCGRQTHLEGLLALQEPFEDRPICDGCYHVIQYLNSTFSQVQLHNALDFFTAKLLKVTTIPHSRSNLKVDPEFISVMEDIQRREAVAAWPGEYIEGVTDLAFIFGTPEYVRRCVADINTLDPQIAPGGLEEYNDWANETGRLQYQEPELPAVPKDLNREERVTAYRELFVEFMKLQLTPKSNDPPKVDPDPQIKKTLLHEDNDAEEILRNYEFIPAGPPTEAFQPD